MKKSKNVTTALAYCKNGMSDQFISFYTKHDGLLKMITLISPTKNDSVFHMLYFYNAYHLSLGLSKLKGVDINSPADAFKFITSSEFAEFDRELIDTIKKNQKLLVSKLTLEQQKKLEKLLNHN